MPARRLIVSLAGCATLALATVLVPGTAQAVVAGPSATLSIDPTHGIPGASLTDTITVANCTGPTFALSESYVDVNGNPASATPATVHVVTSTPHVYTVSLTIPSDAARSNLSGAPVTVTVTATCGTPLVPNPNARVVRSAALTANQAQASDTVLVDALAAAVITADPNRVQLGTPFTFTLTGCVGGLADLYVLDGAGKDFTVADADVTQTSATAYHGTFAIPKTAKVGDGGIVADCAQADSTSAGVAFFSKPTTASSGSGSGSRNGVPVAIPSRPHFTG